VTLLRPIAGMEEKSAAFFAGLISLLGRAAVACFYSTISCAEPDIYVE